MAEEGLAHFDEDLYTTDQTKGARATGFVGSVDAVASRSSEHLSGEGRMRSRGRFDLLFFAECGNGPAVHGGGGACVVSVVGTTLEMLVIVSWGDRPVKHWRKSDRNAIPDHGKLQN